MCEEAICSFHLGYYSCKECDYTLHKFCAQLPETKHNHPLHPDHELRLSKQFQLDDLDYLKSSRTEEKSEEKSKVDIADHEWICSVCDISRKKFYNYHCYTCEFNMDIICATMHDQKLKHPSHPHQLQRYMSRMISGCNACGDEHSGTFYHCTTCFSFRIHLVCALLPAKLLIQQSTNGSFRHPHSLTLKYSFPYIELKAKHFPRCIVCDKRFLFDKWNYRCDECRYYVHVDCATSRKDAFTSSILMPAGVWKTHKNFKDEDHHDAISCPFPDESVNLLKHHFMKEGKSIIESEITHSSHPHPLIHLDSLLNGSVSLHDLMNRVELLCDGCVRPITDVPFYKCPQDDCGFVLHEWCTRLPSEIPNHHNHPQHKLVLLPKVTGKLLGVFDCKICKLPCNGFAYGCMQCKYYVDINCGFIPDAITHEAHPNHLLKRLEYSPWESCKACRWVVRLGDFHCSICDFYLHMRCALLIPRKISHRYDKLHPLILRYYPVKNHSGEYFCEVCERELYPIDWFYHCTMCASSIHTACAPVKVQCERSTYILNDTIFSYINVKFGETVKTADHEHPLTFVQGIDADGECNECHDELKREMILKCFLCNFRIHYECAKESRKKLYISATILTYRIIMDMATSSSSNIQKIELTTSSNAMKQLQHFTHEHLLSLVQLQSDDINEDSDREDEDEDEDKDNIVAPEDHNVGTCNMCEEEIYPFHLCYYSCKDCDYALHKFCAQLPETQQNHLIHPGHKLMLDKGFHFHDSSVKAYIPDYRKWVCTICGIKRKRFYSYHCSICVFHMDIICATMSEQKMDHPSHPHRLQRYFRRCATCCFMIHLDCALLPAKLLIQQSTNGSFSHSHLLTLTYSIPYDEYKAKFFPLCRVCHKSFIFDKWHYKCDKCRYYVHVGCATSPRDAFTSSILMPAGFGKTHKNFKDDDYPNLICCPFPNESANLLMLLFINRGELVTKRKIDGEMFCHPHPLILFDTPLNGSVSLHNPMKRMELLCGGCVRPITDVPFYKCSQDNCGFVLHEWCTRLPSEIQNHHNHPQHKLVLMPKVPGKLLGVFACDICWLPCNGFAYGCMQCEYYVDINCGFIPDVITHEAHPNHLLLRFKASSNDKFCEACMWSMAGVGFHCPSCDFYLHTKCALLLPRTIRHKYDKHPLNLRYYPAENHSGEYFCDICEDEFDPDEWFYHCSTCASSMHGACAPLKLQCEQSTYSMWDKSIFRYINVKFGGTIVIKDHRHPLTFVQGINADGHCRNCYRRLQYEMIFKCSQCKFAICYECVIRKYHDVRVLYDRSNISSNC
ncbi:uncharacterized protein LOC143585879 [Bidens hawaiensis]|uniref:uncharacterized protein LOC143585879 n=1 Tax=Bidens hawaiensis TaxID=980011 RepID=UPI00404B15DB